MTSVQDGEARPLIEFRNVSMEYRSTSGEITTVFKSLDLAIRAGEFFCVIGPSGCGKTTLLNMIAGFVACTSGSVLANGHQIVAPGADRGCVFQEYSLFPWLTVEQNIEFGLRSRGVPKDERRDLVDRHLNLIGLNDTRKKYPFELSGGMQQRVGIARALVNSPAILLMDEPFAAIDALTRNTMQRELLGIWQKTRTTVFYITHNIEEAVFLSTRVAVMSSRPGRIARIVEVEIEHPRERTEPHFNSIYRELETTLYAHIDSSSLRAL
jgi:ABC-type nitrate/sulfonate/bicarbonate transport system ATPase subunit